MPGINVAIVGATGSVGQEMIRLLNQGRLPVAELRCFASPRSAGQHIEFQNRSIPVHPLTDNCFQGIDVTFFSAGKSVSLLYAPQAVLQGSWVIDNSSAFRMNPSTPLVVPEIHKDTLPPSPAIIASPNCVATIAALVLAPLQTLSPIRRIIATTYQAASGAGHRAMVELQEETAAYLASKSYHRSVMPHPYAFNLFPHNAPMMESHYNDEESKIIEELRKILSTPKLRIGVTSVRVPVLRAHSIALNVEFKQSVLPQAAKDLLHVSQGITVLENWEQNRFPMPLDASGQDNIFVGRIRTDCSNPNTLDLWVVGDQLLKGAALNVIQIAHKIFLSSKIEA